MRSSSVATSLRRRPDRSSTSSSPHSSAPCSASASPRGWFNFQTHFPSVSPQPPFSWTDLQRQTAPLECRNKGPLYHGQPMWDTTWGETSVHILMIGGLIISWLFQGIDHIFLGKHSPQNAPKSPPTRTIARCSFGFGQCLAPNFPRITPDACVPTDCPSWRRCLAMPGVSSLIHLKMATTIVGVQ